MAALIRDLSAEDRRLFRETPKEELDRFHFGLGMGIRNEFGLWAGNRELLESCARRMPEYKKWRAEADRSGGDFQVHPDSASGVIIEALWDALHKTGR